MFWLDKRLVLEYFHTKGFKVIECTKANKVIKKLLSSSAHDRVFFVNCEHNKSYVVGISRCMFYGKPKLEIKLLDYKNENLK